MIICRWVPTLDGYSRINDKYKVILVVLELMFCKAGSAVNTSQESCTSGSLTRAGERDSELLGHNTDGFVGGETMTPHSGFSIHSKKKFLATAGILHAVTVACLSGICAYAQSGSPGNLSTVAGNGTMGYTGDGGPGTSAEINYVDGLATDLAGNLYIADTNNNCVRKLTASTGIITTVAGNGIQNFSGDGGPATDASLAHPEGITVDAAGNLFIADGDNGRIRRVDGSTGIISTAAGNGNWDFEGDGGVATSAALGLPFGVAVDNSGNLYIADFFNHRIRKVTASTGIITTIAGTGSETLSGDGGPATNAGIPYPAGIFLDSSKDIYIIDMYNNRIRKIDASTGIITTIAGNGTFGYAGDGGPATSAAMENPSYVAVDFNKNLFIADTGSNVVREVNASTGIITTIAGNGVGSYSGDGGPATSATIGNPSAVALDASGNLYIADRSDLRVRVVYGSELTGLHRAITIDHTKVFHTDQTNFPVLISGTYQFLATIANGGQVQNVNGYDIAFASDEAGQNRLNFEIDTYDPVTGKASFWVRMPTLSHTTDTTIYMFYGVPGISTSQENKAGVWSNGYLSVYHLGNGTTVGLVDSGSAGYNLAGSTPAGMGMIGGGAMFNGNPATYLYHDSVPAYPSGSSPVTLEAWVQMAPGGSGEIAGYGANSFNGSRAGLGSDGTNLVLEFENVGIVAPQPANSSWHHVVGVYGGGPVDTTSRLYVDGVPLSTTLVGGTPAITTTEFKIGGIPTVASCCAWSGSVDEVRVSSVIRSADWVATEYANESSPSTFYSIGAQNGGQGGGQGNLVCSPSILYAGSNTTCSVGLPSSATAQVTFSLDGQYSAIASPNSLGLFDALINLASASVGSHTVAFSYPGDGINSAESGSTTVTVEAAGTTLPNESLVYQYSITKPDGSSGFAPNGNVLGSFDSINGMWSEIQYDGLNRLISAQVTPPISSTQASYFCWSFDSFGNRTGQSLSNQAFSSSGTQPCQPASGATYSSSQIQYASTNQISTGTWQSQQGGFVTGTPGYDPSGNGNMTNDLQNQYLYDAEGRVCAVQIPSAPSLPNQMVQYLYDAEGNRIGKGTITQWNCDVDNNGFSLTNEYVLGQGGEQVTEIDGSSNGGKWIHTNAYAGGQLIATYDNLGLHYQLADWLGTQRAQVSPAGVIEETCQSLPFGDQLNCVQTSVATADDSTEHHFTGKERDTESGLDYFGARYYASNMGRWMSPDSADIPMPVPYANLNNPQSLNLYGYVNNNPLSDVDDDGHDGALPTATCGGGLGGALCRVIQFLGKLGGPGEGPPPGSGPGDFWPNPYGQQVSKQVGQNANQAMPYITGGAIVAAGAAAAPAAILETGPAVGGLSRAVLQRFVSQAENPALKDIVSRLYQATDQVPGGTAGAIRNGVDTGEFISEGGHVMKASQRIVQLNKLIKGGALTGRDLVIARWVLSDLKNAVGR